MILPPFNSWKPSSSQNTSPKFKITNDKAYFNLLKYYWTLEKNNIQNPRITTRQSRDVSLRKLRKFDLEVELFYQYAEYDPLDKGLLGLRCEIALKTNELMFDLRFGPLSTEVVTTRTHLNTMARKRRLDLKKAAENLTNERILVKQFGGYDVFSYSLLQEVDAKLKSLRELTNNYSDGGYPKEGTKSAILNKKFSDLGLFIRISKWYDTLYWENPAAHDSPVYNSAFTSVGLTAVAFMVMNHTLYSFVDLPMMYSPELKIMLDCDNAFTIYRLASEQIPRSNYYELVKVWKDTGDLITPPVDHNQHFGVAICVLFIIGVSVVWAAENLQ